MFICSVRASTIRFFLVIALTLAALFTWFGLSMGQTVAASGEEGYRYTGAREEEGRIAFLRQFGIEVKTEGAEEETFTVPENFDRVLLGYNEVQKAQGLDIAKYRRKKLTRYTYEVTNSDAGGTVYVNLLVYRDKVVGADVCSADPRGFVLPLTEFNKASSDTKLPGTSDGEKTEEEKKNPTPDKEQTPASAKDAV